MPVSYALTTVARQKTFMSMSGSTYDTILERLIDVATDFIERWCDRRFMQQAISNEVYDGNGTNRIVLRQYPIDTSATFRLEVRDGADNVDSWTEVDENDYFVKGAAGIVEYVNGVFRNIRQHYRFTYTAGYDFDVDAAPTPSYPAEVGAADLEFACWKLVAKAFNDRKNASNISSESLGDYSVSFTREAMLDKEIKEILYNFKRPVQH